LEGGDDGDWLWLGGNTRAIGGSGSDRFMVYGGQALMQTAANVAALMPDFNPNEDVLFSYDAWGNFQIAQFNLQGHVSSWATVNDVSYKQQLVAQWQQSASLDLGSIQVAGNALSLDFGAAVVNAATDFSSWSLNGQGPVSANLSGSLLTLNYANAISASQILDLSKSALSTSLGRGLAFSALYLGSSQADVLNASNQSKNLVIWGGTGADVLTGGTGHDVLIVSTGATTQLTGGLGADVFRYEGALSSGGVSTVTDFNFAQGDTLDLDALLNNMPSNVDFLSCLNLQSSGQDLWLNVQGRGLAQSASPDFRIRLADFFVSQTLPEYALETLLQSTHQAVVLV
jgi:hypothetical protein